MSGDVARGGVCGSGRDPGGTRHAPRRGVSGERAALPLTSSSKLLAAKNSKSHRSQNFEVPSDLKKIAQHHSLVRVPAARRAPMDALPGDEDPNYPRLPRSPQPPDAASHAAEQPIVIAVGRNWNEVRSAVNPCATFYCMCTIVCMRLSTRNATITSMAIDGSSL